MCSAKIVGGIDTGACHGDEHRTVDARAFRCPGGREPLRADRRDISDTETTEHHDECVDLGERSLQDSLVVRVAGSGVHARSPQERHRGRGCGADLAALLDETTREQASEGTMGGMHEDRHEMLRPEVGDRWEALRTGREDRPGTTLTVRRHGRDRSDGWTDGATTAAHGP